MLVEEREKGKGKREKGNTDGDTTRITRRHKTKPTQRGIYITKAKKKKKTNTISNVNTSN